MKIIERLRQRILAILGYENKPETISRCPFCGATLSSIIQCHAEELGRPELFYRCNGRETHFFNDAKELTELTKEKREMRRRMGEKRRMLKGG